MFLNRVNSSAPLRLGLGGGGTDLPQYCKLYGGDVVNCTIDLRAHAEISAASGRYTVLESKDYNVLGDERGTSVNHPGLKLARVTYRRFLSDVLKSSLAMPIKIRTYSDVPVETGLGASSAMIVAILCGLCRYFEVEMRQEDVARLSFHIERHDAQLNCGWQDHFAPVFGGINRMIFSRTGEARIFPLAVSMNFLRKFEEQSILAYFGSKRSKLDRKSIESSKDEAQEGKSRILSLKRRSAFAAHAIGSESIESLAQAIVDGWHTKKRFDPSVEAPLDEQMEGILLSSGALAFRMIGASGGGMMYVLARRGYARALERKFGEFGAVLHRLQITQSGVEVHDLPQASTQP